MKIGEASNRTGLSVSNIRFYERKGLLSPQRRQESGYREYGEEDVRRLKEIVLLRRLALPVESIYLLYEGKAELLELLKRQEKELLEEKEQLEGSLGLCRLLKKEGTSDIGEVDVDHYLNYVKEEEAQGGRFAPAEEMLEDLAEFSQIARFRGDPYAGRFFRSRWTARILAALLTLALIWAAYDTIAGPEGIKWQSLGFWVLVYAALAVGFVRYRYLRRREQKEDEE